MAARGFVSEKEIEEERKRRQEEWDKVRQPEQPKEAPEPEDKRPLYDRLKQQRDLKQLEFDEGHKLKNMLRGLDSEEVGFLDYVDKMRRDEEVKRLNEERELIAEVKKHTTEILDPVDASKISEMTRRPLHASTSKAKAPSKQAQLLAGVVKKRKADDESGSQSEEKKTKSVDDDSKEGTVVNVRTAYPSAAVAVGVRLSATQRVGVLPGLETYAADSSDDSSNSSSDTDEADSWMVFTTPVQLRIDRKQAEAAAKSD